MTRFLSDDSILMIRLRSLPSHDGKIFFGGHSEGETPLLIPNRVVKTFRADGTAWGTLWESRSSPRDF